LDRRDTLQLLPGTKKRLGIKVPGENRFLYIGSAILGAVLITSFTLGRYETSLEKKLEGIDNKLLAIEKQRDKGVETSMVTLKKRLELTKNLIDDHVYWTKGLSKVAGLLQREVRLTSFSGDVTKKTISIEGTALSFTVLARQIASFLADDSVEDLTLGFIKPTSEGTISFTMALTFVRAKLLNKL